MATKSSYVKYKYKIYLYQKMLILLDLSTLYYKWSNPDVVSTEQELINIFKHQIYKFDLNL